MKILITGGGGFIGGHFIEACAERGWSRTVVDFQEKLPLSPRVNQSNMAWDIRTPGTIKQEPSEAYAACVHLAAIASPRECAAEPRNAWETNVVGTYNVLRLCERLNIPRVIFFSSAHVYGISPKYLPTDETHPLALMDCYTTTKVVGEKLCDFFWENYGISYTAFRLYNAYGPKQDDKYFVGKKLKQALAGDVTIMNGSVTKDWVWVGDVVDAIVKAVKSDYVGSMNIGTGVETPLQEIAQRFADHFDRKLVPEEGSDASPSRMCADYSRARRVLGWYPRVSVNEGLLRLIQSVD